MPNLTKKFFFYLFFAGPKRGQPTPGFSIFIRSVGRTDVCLLTSKRVSIHSLRDKETKTQTDKRTNGQMDKETKGQNDRGTKKGRDKGTKGQKGQREKNKKIKVYKKI